MEIKKSDKDVEELNEISIINNDFKIEENDDLFEIKPTILYIEETINQIKQQNDDDKYLELIISILISLIYTLIIN